MHIKNGQYQELIKKHSKHVITRGTHAPEQPVLYSVGTNTQRVMTRDVQLMFTPKSRDVSLCTDSVNHIRDVGLMCNIDSLEQTQKLEEIVELKRKYEFKLTEICERQSSMRHVSTICNLDLKDCRTIGLGCNLEEVREMRDVSLKCNLDKELRVQHDVGIVCCMDKKPEKRDAYVCTNIIQRKEMRSHSVTACIEDPEKVRISRELEELRYRISIPKLTRDVACSMEHRSRLTDNLVRNQSSSMERVRTIARQVNTEAKSTRETSCGSALSYNFMHNSIGCQANDNSFEKVTTELIEQKSKLEYERNQYVELTNELKIKLRELEEKYFEERNR